MSVNLCKSTSELEAFHSLIYNRSLLRKSSNMHYESDFIQAAGGAASLYWNLGSAAIETVLSKVAWWEVNAVSREKLKKEWLANKKQAKQKLRRKQKQQARELKQQKQFQTTSKQRKEAEKKKSKVSSSEIEKLVTNAPYVPSSVACKQFNKD